jgi:hypothetical protein
MRTKLLIAAAVAAACYVSASPAMADDWHHNDHDHDHGHDYHGPTVVQPVIVAPVRQSGVPGHPNWDYGHQKKWALHQEAVVRHDQRLEDRRHFNSWNDERSHYQNNWRRLNAQQQATYDAEMRQQWLAYHHGSWTGDYRWSNYSDPGFLDYLHSNRPSLLTRIGGAFGL